MDFLLYIFSTAIRAVMLTALAICGFFALVFAIDLSMRFLLRIFEYVKEWWES